MYVLYGALGCLACLFLIGIGLILGWTLRGLYVRGFTSRPAMTDLEKQTQEEQRRKLKAEQQAFHAIQNYSTERAYGMADIPATPEGGAAD